MSNRCGDCKSFKYKIDEDGNVEFWRKGDCLHREQEVYDAALCDDFKKKNSNN